jgi:hypothetical protein
LEDWATRDWAERRNTVIICEVEIVEQIERVKRTVQITVVENTDNFDGMDFTWPR